MTTRHSNRKNEHLSLATKFWRDNENPVIGPGFDAVRWVPGPLKNMAVSQVDSTVQTLEHDFTWPFYIEAMTGGSPSGTKVNAALAQVAKKTGLAMAVGSQSVALKDKQLVESFQTVRTNHPDGFLMANLGADHPFENVQAAIDMIDANAIELHINVGQELAMAEGDRRFYWLDNLANIIAKAPVPVIVKEVGFGMGPALLKQLADLHPAAINIGGGNGTNFGQIEQRRDHENENPLNLSPFGLSTVESLLSAQKAGIDRPIIATGGIQSINDVVTAHILGAKLSSSAGYFLKILMTAGPVALEKEIEDWQQALPQLMTLLGAQKIADLSQQPRLYRSDLQNFYEQL